MTSVFEQFRVLIAPGLHNSGPDHWQSRWQRLFPAFERVQQDDWEVPDLPRWSARVDQVRQRGNDPRPTLIVAHSFGALATVHSVARNDEGVAGVLLVAPADPDKFNVASLLRSRRWPCRPSWLAVPTIPGWQPRAPLCGHSAGTAALSTVGRWGISTPNPVWAIGRRDWKPCISWPVRCTMTCCQRDAFFYSGDQL
jgi:pimeloyl-ACP methyl ester carboxylesterase